VTARFLAIHHILIV